MQGASREIAIIGAGIAGMSAAAVLQRAGHRVTVFEKSRGPGGRSASRRQEPLRFDHGAPFFAVQDPKFQRVAQEWQAQGLVAPWKTQIAEFRSDGPGPRRAFEPLIAVPKMSALARAIGTSVQCHYSTRIASLKASPTGGWTLESNEHQQFQAELVLLTPPPAQSLALLDSHSPGMSEALNSVEAWPEWCVMLSGLPDILDEEIGVADFVDHPSLSRFVAEHRKDQRPAQAAWTLHARGDWSQANLEKDADWVAKQLGGDLLAALNKTGAFATQKAHRWRFARVRNPIQAPFLADAEAGLYYCGDSCLQGDLESAYLSGSKAAEAVLSNLSG